MKKKKKKDTKKDKPLDLSKHPEHKSQQDQYYSSSIQRSTGFGVIAHLPTLRDTK